MPSIPKCYKISTLFTLINDTLSEWWILSECNLKDNIILGRKKSSGENLEQLLDEILPSHCVVKDVGQSGNAGSKSHSLALVLASILQREIFTVCLEGCFGLI